MSEFEPCPFCGKEAWEPIPKRWANAIGDESWSAYVHCPKCDYFVETNSVGYETPEMAVDAVAEKWNTRATLGSGTCKPTEEDCCPFCGEDLVKCNVGIGELGGAVELDPPIYHNYCPNCGRKVVS